MNQHDETDRLLAAWMDAEAPRLEPDGLLDRILTTTSRSRPRPAWLVHLKGNVMSAPSRPFSQPAARWAILLVALGLLVVATLAIGPLGGGRGVAPVIPDSPSPSPSAEPSPSPSPSSVASVSASARALRPTEEGDALPEELLGVWVRQVDDAFFTIRPTNDPVCISKFQTAQNCITVQFPDSARRETWGALVTWRGDHLYWLPIGENCSGQPTFMEYTLVDDRLTLQVLPNSCFSAEGPFVRAGTNGAPTAPPEPAG